MNHKIHYLRRFARVLMFIIYWSSCCKKFGQSWCDLTRWTSSCPGRLKIASKISSICKRHVEWTLVKYSGTQIELSRVLLGGPSFETSKSLLYFSVTVPSQPFFIIFLTLPQKWVAGSLQQYIPIPTVRDFRLILYIYIIHVRSHCFLLPETPTGHDTSLRK